MATTGQQTAYRCEQCGSPEIVALSLLHEQGTRNFSGRLTSGVSQSYTAKAASPPRPRGYLRACLGWGFPIVFCFFWGLLGLSAILRHSKAPISLEITVAVLLFLGCILILRLLFSFHKTSRYNKEVYTRLSSDWADTFMCRRCGKYSLIRP
jgi:predicted RNA-binding Zn-ribbon protein involved in translation (DUF1610 family)